MIKIKGIKGLMLVVVLWSCNSCQSDKKPPKKLSDPPKETVSISVPVFSSDSAYSFIEKQVSFGPRVPATKTHAACADWIESTLSSWGWVVQFQEAEIEGYDGPLQIKNIIASYKPEAEKRVLLCAHWDTRRMADQDSERKDEAILGADDGGSGVGIIMEIARVVSQHGLNTGIEIVFFDAEDQGESNSPRPSKQTWCLGSQHWAANLHPMKSKPYFGILLDMVGFKNARFPLEGISRKRAQGIQQGVWQTAQKLGFSDLFVMEQKQDLVDDHLFINDIARIPTIDIINLPTNPAANGTFGYYWHTHDDNMEIIGKNTLNAVGKTLIRYLYERDVYN